MPENAEPRGRFTADEVYEICKLYSGRYVDDHCPSDAQAAELHRVNLFGEAVRDLHAGELAESKRLKVVAVTPETGEVLCVNHWGSW